ncbi:MAG: hypothetical protein EBR99_02190 [Actinobacteria bacterium]|nr:hypothetical protein [Actinomycetota bacterium]
MTYRETTKTPTVNTSEEGRAIFPELVESARADYRGAGTWTVETGAPSRGEAWTNLDERTIRVPRRVDHAADVNGAVASIIRAHELTHVRLSPVITEADELGAICKHHGLDPALVHAVEEVRINRALKDLGFDLKDLTDGTEKDTGAKAFGDGSPERWNAVLTFFVALSGTPAQGLFARALRKSSPEWGEVLKGVEKRIKKAIKESSHNYRTSTDPAFEFTEEETFTIPYGFRWTLETSKVLQRYVMPEGATTDGMGEKQGVGKEFPQGRAEGQWTPLVFDSSVVPTVPVRGALLKRRVTPSNTGASVRYAGRMLSDPQRRVFGGSRKDVGGVVVVDVSGSMSLTEHDLVRILDAAPMATVFAYSGAMTRRKATGFTVPNAWLLSWNGKRIQDLKAVQTRWEENGGNGVDGPAVAHAVAVAGRRSSPGTVSPVEWRASKGAKGVPVVWVTDGAVTDSHDYIPPASLMGPLADLVHRAGVIITPTPESAVAVLRAPSLSRARVDHHRLASVIRKSHGGAL